MEWITYSWLSCCAIAPSAGALSVWTLFIFHTYRRRWRTMDIFLLTIALQEIPSSLCAFGFSVHTVIRSRSESSCHLIIWGLTTIRVFQLTTLTSLAFDRALTLKWPYKYRFSVRHSQIRYHIVVLGVISSLVGIAGLFARLQYQDFSERLLPNSEDYSNSANKTTNFYCTLHPFSWDFRYNLFISALYAILALITLICTVYIEIHRFRGPTISRANSRISSVGNLVGDHLGSSDPIGRCESYRTLYGFQTGKQGSINKKILDDQRAFDLRWASVIGSLALCYALNHGPYLAFMITGSIVQFWNPLHDNIVIWFGIVEGILLPIALYITDDPFRDAVKRSFKRKNYRCSDVTKSSNEPFPLYFNDFALIDKPYVGAMSSIPTAKLNTSPLTVVSNYRRSSLRGINEKHRRSTASEQFTRTNNGYLQQSSLRKCKLPKNNDRYMFLSIYGVDKVIPVNKQSITYGNESNPYYKNTTTLSTFAGSEDSINKEKLNSIEKKSTIDNKVWYSSNSGKCNEVFRESQAINDGKGFKRNLDDHIYATLSETFSVRSTLPDKRQLQQLQQLDDQKINSQISSNERIIQNSIISLNQNYAKSRTNSVDGLSMSGVSFTTAANDDFEYMSTTIDKVHNDDSFDRNDSSSLSSGSYSVHETQPKKGQIYDNLAFEYENTSSIVREPNSYNASGLETSSSVSAINYLQRRYSPFVHKSSNNNYYKRRGRQSFSTSDINKLDSQHIYSLQPINSNNTNSNCNNISIKSKREVEDQSRSTACSSNARKAVSETNLLLSANNKSDSITRIDEHNRLENYNIYDRQSSHCRQLYDTQSSDSIDSNSSSTSSSDLHNKLMEVLKRKEGRKEGNTSSAAIRQNAYLSKAKPRTRTKKYKIHKRDEQIIQRNQESLYQKSNEKSTNNGYGSQSVWNIESKPIINRNNGVNRIGSYAQEWYRNKSMPDLSSLQTCSSPIFSPLYKKGSKSIGQQTKE